MILSDGSTYKYPGHIYDVNRQVDIQTGTIECKGIFPNPGHVLRPGTLRENPRRRRATVHKALLVPQDAVLETQGQYQVAVVGSDNKVTMRTVAVGKQSGGLQIIDQGVSPGERVITEGLQKVPTGWKWSRTFVRPEPAAAESPDVRRQAPSAAATPAARASAMSKFFINRPIVAIVIAIFFVITGRRDGLSASGRAVPESCRRRFRPTATYTGADALTVEQSVATPIEEQVNGAKNMLYMQSINGNDGTMTLQVNFDVGTDVDLDQVKVQNRLAQAQLEPAARR